MRRSAEDAWKTRQTILAAALGAFEAHGWRGATFEVIATASGVSRGALNHHFSSKQELLSDALAYGWSNFHEKLFADDTASPDPAENLRILLSRYIRWLQNDAEFRALVTTTVIVAPQAPDDGSSEKSEGLRTWRQQVGECLTTDVRLPVPVETISRNVVVFLEGLAVSAITNPDDLPQPGEIDSDVDYLVHGFLGLGFSVSSH